MRLTRSVVTLAALLALGLGLAWSLPSPAQAGGKIAVVDMERAVNNCKAGKRAQAELKRKAEKLQAELKKLGKEVQKLRDELENTAMLLKAEARLAKQREFERKLRLLRDRQRDAKQEMMEAQRAAFAPILRKMQKIIRQIGAKGGYALITETRAALYYPKSADITDQVIAAYDKVNP
jgi:outer membrane protein